MQSMLPVKGTILVEFQLFLGISPVFFGRVVPPLTFTALKRNELNRCLFARHYLYLLSPTMEFRLAKPSIQHPGATPRVY
jgi:hypothetical protein